MSLFWTKYVRKRRGINTVDGGYLAVIILTEKSAVHDTNSDELSTLVDLIDDVFNLKELE